MFHTLHAAAQAIKLADCTPVQILDDCLDRIDHLESRIHAWVSVDRDGAREQAKALGEELRLGRWRGLLHGIPLGVKDIIDIFDWPTAAGFSPWASSNARQDATVIRRLRQAGAIILGKTVTTQFAGFDPGPTSNPWDERRTPGGSSSGSAAAVACGMCLGALGSQTGGSITRPASYCGVAGLKPTFGRVSTRGVVPLAPSLDHVGVIAPCVRDLAILFQAIAGADPLDPLSCCHPVPDYLQHLSQQTPVPRFARAHGLFTELAEPAMVRLLDTVSDQFEAAGAGIRSAALPAGFADVLRRHRTIMAVEAAAFHDERLRRLPEDYLPNIRSLIEEGRACPALEYARCQEHRQLLKRELWNCFEGVDALLTPATPGLPPGVETTGNPAFNSPWSFTGFPTVSFRASLSAHRLPMAIQLVGKPWDEAGLLRAAAWCEQVLGIEPLQPPL